MKKRKPPLAQAISLVVLLCWASTSRAEESSGVLVPARIANAPLAPEQPKDEGLLATRGKRLAFGALFGAVAGAAGAAIGAVVLSRTTSPTIAPPLGSTWLGASVGWAVGVPLGVLLAGALFDGDGSWWATVLGDIGGGLVGATMLFVTGGHEALPVFAVLTLGGSLLGYELTSHAARVNVMPTVSVTATERTVGVAGTW